MPATRVSTDLRSALLRAVWAQWRALGSPASGGPEATTIVDPEALILASAGLVEHERRLWDLVHWWAARASDLLSVQRMKNLAPTFPPPFEEGVTEFAFLAFEEGHDARWKSVERKEPIQQSRVEKVEGSGSPRLLSAPALLVRLRRGLGVGVKPDVLGVLIGMRGASGSVAELAMATSYSKRAVRRAADEMAEARLLRISSTTPTRYSADVESWLAVLDLPEPAPAWVYWQRLFAFSFHALSLLEEEGKEETTGEYVLSTRVRDLVEEYRDGLRRNNIDAPDPERYRGEEYLDAFVAWLDRFIAWLDEHH